jgi:ABC-2 type transport system ATP-binding protein
MSRMNSHPEARDQDTVPSELGALQVRSLGVKVRSRHLLDGVSFKVSRSEITCVVGPNGAGKSTLLELLVGLRLPSEGSLSLAGRPLTRFADFASAFAFLPAFVELPPEMTVRALVAHALVRGPRPEGLIAHLRRALGIEPLAQQPAGTLSRGEAQRVQLFCTLSQNKPIVVLDEPFGAFDPLQLREVLTAVKAVAAAGAMIIAAVHQLSDAQKIADRIMILENGRCLAWGSLDALRQHSDLPGASLEQIFVTLLSGQHAP